jgi:hypothetical protein
MRVVAVFVLLLVAAPAAQAKSASKNLWATVNVCDTKKAPNDMGVRARMPGDGTHRRMYMRFTAQYRAAPGKWKVVRGLGRSPWYYAGSALFRTQELGYTFSFDKPKPGSSYVMRGLVQFQWRAPTSGSVVKRKQRLTEGGHPTKPADPPKYSRATCKISTPAASGE